MKPLLDSLAEYPAAHHQRIASAVASVYDSHRFVCDRLVGKCPSLMMASGSNKSGAEQIEKFKHLRLKVFETEARGGAAERALHENRASSVVSSNRQKLKTGEMNHSNQKQRIAIIGMSGRYPGGADTVARLWENLKAGVDAVSEARGERWDLGHHHPDPARPERVYTRCGGFLDRIDTFDHEFFGLSPREVKQVDPQQRLLLELAWEALEDAAIPPDSIAGSDTGVFVGISSNDYSSLEGLGGPDAYSNTGSAFSIAANRISYFLDLHGPSVAMDTACSSTIVGVHQACISLMNGDCSMALVGGISLLMHIRPWIGFAKASMLSPTGRCKSFDASGDGYVRSEGGGIVVLKPLDAAERDGDRIYGVIVGSAINSDGHTMGLSMPNVEAQETLLRKVYSECGVLPEDVVYVEAHGTGTAVGDPIECESIGRVLGAPRTDGSICLIGSVKSNIGHLEAASGMAGMTKALLALHHGEVPGNLHFETPNPKIKFDEWKLGVLTTTTPLPQTRKSKCHRCEFFWLRWNKCSLGHSGVPPRHGCKE